MRIQLSEVASEALHHDCPILVVGGPGSGKTTLSLLKAQSLVPTLEPGQEILFLSFSRAAVRQVELRCRDVLNLAERRQVAVRTYHAFALDIIRVHGRLLNGFVPRIIYPAEEKVISASFEGDWETEAQRMAQDEGRYVFGQLAAAAAKLVGDSDAIASLLANIYPVIILDEFQDTDDAQWELVKALSVRSRLVFMADPDQRIFDYDPHVSPDRIKHLRDALAPVEFDLGSENYRSPHGRILLYANAVLKNRPLPKTNDVKSVFYRSPFFDTLVHLETQNMFGALRKSGIVNPSVAVLARTNTLVAQISRILQENHRVRGAALKPIDHDVVWDAHLTSAAAQVVASILQWNNCPIETALERTFNCIADYFQIRNATKATETSRQSYERYRTAASDASQGKRLKLKSARSLHSACSNGISLLGDPVADWMQARNLLDQKPDLSALLNDARFINLFRATDEIGSRLAEAWDRDGSYGNTTVLVRRALEASIVQSDQRVPRGCVLMTIHKAKGKEFDGVLLVEGRYQGTFFRGTDSEKYRASARRLLRVGITRARQRVTIIRPKGAIPLVSSWSVPG